MKKFKDLLVAELRAELGRRNLDIKGIKQVLSERLRKALEAEGINPDDFDFIEDFVQSSPLKLVTEMDPAHSAINDTSSTEADIPALKTEEMCHENGTYPETVDEANVGEEAVEEEGEGDLQEEYEDGKEWEVDDDVGDGEGEGDAYEGGDGDAYEGGDGDAYEGVHNNEDFPIDLHAEDDDNLDFDERMDQDDASVADGKERIKADSAIPGEDGGNNTEATSSTQNIAESGSATTGESQDSKECEKAKSSSVDKDGQIREDRGSQRGSTSAPGNLRSLWVSGLTSSTRAQDLKTVFSKYGKVVNAKIVTNTRIPGGKCYGFVTVNTEEEVAKCIEKLNHTELHGRMIQVEMAKGEPGASRQRNYDGGSNHRRSDSKRDAASDRRRESDRKDGLIEGIKDVEKNAVEGGVTSGRTSSKDRSSTRDRERNRSRDLDRNRPGRGGTGGRPFDRRGPPDRRSDSYHSRERKPAEVLDLRQIMDERERERNRNRERTQREEERRRREEEMHRRDVERRQREEAERLHREREKLRIERERIEKQRQELLRMEREQQRIEREKLERERDELRRQQMRFSGSPGRYEERRSVKRPGDERGLQTDRRSSNFMDERSAKRPAPERSRFPDGPRGIPDGPPPPPPRFDRSQGPVGNGGRGEMRSMGPPVGGMTRFSSDSRRDDRRQPIERGGPPSMERGGMPPRGDRTRDHRPVTSSPPEPRDRSRDRYGSNPVSSSGNGSWRTTTEMGGDSSKGYMGGPPRGGSSLLGGSSVGGSVRGSEPHVGAWRSSGGSVGGSGGGHGGSGSGGGRWAPASSSLGRGGIGNMSNMVRSDGHHITAPSMGGSGGSSLGLPMVSQTSRYSSMPQMDYRSKY